MLRSSAIPTTSSNIVNIVRRVIHRNLILRRSIQSIPFLPYIRYISPIPPISSISLPLFRRLSTIPVHSNSSLHIFTNFRVSEQTNGIFRLEECRAFYADEKTLEEDLKELNRPGLTIFSATLAVNFLYQLGKKRVDISDYKCILTALSQSISTLQNPFLASTITNLCFGIQSVKPQSKETLSLIGEIGHLLANAKVTADNLLIAGSCHGLQNMKGESVEERVLISSLAKIITSSKPIQLDSYSIGSIIYGIQSLASYVSEVQQLYRALSIHLEYSQLVKLTERDIGSVVYGMQSLRMESVDEKRLMLATVRHLKISLNEFELNHTTLSSIVYGLRKAECHKSNESREYVGLIAKLVSSQKNLKIPVSVFGHFMFCLQNNHAKYDEELQLIDAIANTAVVIDGSPLEASKFSKLVYGLRFISGKTIPERNLLRKITNILSEIPPITMNEQSLCNIMIGIRHLQPNIDEVEQLVVLLSKIIMQQNHLRLTGLQVGVCCYGLSNYTGRYFHQRLLIRSIIPHILSAKKPNPNDSVHQKSLPSQAFANMYFGLCGFTGFYQEEREYMTTIFNYLSNFKYCQLSTQSLSGACFSIATLKPNRKECRELIELLSKTIRMTKQVSLNGPAVASILFGLSSMTGKSYDEESIINSISSLLESTIQPYPLHYSSSSYSSSLPSVPLVMDAVRISSAMSGIRQLKPKYSHVKRLYRVFLSILEQNKNVVFDSVTLGSLCYGLESMTPSSEEEIKFIEYVIHIFAINSPHIPLVGTAIGKAIAGLRSFTGHHPLERRLIDIIASKLTANTPCNLNNRTMELAFYGFQSMTGRSTEEINLLSIFIKYLEKSTKEIFSPKQIMDMCQFTRKLQRGLGEDAKQRMDLFNIIATIVESQPVSKFHPIYTDKILNVIRSLDGATKAEERLTRILQSMIP